MSHDTMNIEVHDDGGIVFATYENGNVLIRDSANDLIGAVLSCERSAKYLRKWLEASGIGFSESALSGEALDEFNSIAKRNSEAIESLREKNPVRNKPWAN